MTTYYVPVAEELLRDAVWSLIPGFRLVSKGAPFGPYPGTTLCTFEDDDAPADLEGKLVEPTITREIRHGGMECHYFISGRRVIE